MVVRVEKAAFNLRDKLTELDYVHVPYEKIPSGTVIQHVYNQNMGATHLTTTSTTWADLSYSVAITPHFDNSLLLIEWSATGQQPNTATGASAVTIYRNNTTNLGATTGSNMGMGCVGDFGGSGGVYVTASSSFALYDEPKTRESVSYHIWGRTTSSGTAYIAHAAIVRCLSVKEIRQ
tara:strand:+ start:2256 stop:2789 length:534 start_codon:yes stop_codon:yes gene_type:complete